MTTEATAELREYFASGTSELEADVVAELSSIMRLHQLSAEDMFYKWESYCIKMDMDTSGLNMTSVRSFKQDVQDALEKSSRAHHVKQEKRPAATPRPGAKTGDVFNMLDSLVPNTPGTAKLNARSVAKKKAYETPSLSRVKAEVPSSSPDYKTPMRTQDQVGGMNSAPPSSFVDRQNAGDVIEVLNDHLPVADSPFAPYAESRIRLTAASDQKKLGYKAYAMKLSEASEILDDRIDEFRYLVQQHHALDPSVFGNAASQGTSEIVAVGRIASDSTEGRLNAASLVLETSRRTGGGLRVPLNMGKFAAPGKGYSFFPGQIVALRGTNATGFEFVVEEILEVPLLSNAASTPEQIEQHRLKLRGDANAMDSDSDPPPLNILFASGPYTADDNLDFEPLHALCSQAADTYADALVLTGPFIDAEHPLVAIGDFDLPDDALLEPDTATMSTVFKYLISPALNGLVNANPHITILLIPSVRDVIDKHAAWPQDIFPRKDLGLHKAVKVVTNPMTLSMNEMVLGISSQDVLYELRQEELLGGKPKDPVLLSRISRYLIEQRHYFPLFPPSDRQRLPKVGTVEGLPPGAALDTSYLKLGEMVNVRPDVLMIPSSLPPFARVIESVLVINPGYLSKRRGAGTYAKMTLYPPTAKESQMNQGMISHSVFKRARVEITKI